MARPPQDGASGPRVRARARGSSTAIRPEVADALGGLERSLAEVARWEQLLAGRPDSGGPVIPVLPEGYVGLSPEVLEPPRAREPDLADDEVEHDLGAPRVLRDRPAAPPSPEDIVEVPIAPLLTEFQGAGDARKVEDDDEDEPDPEPGIVDTSVLWSARTVDAPSPAVEQADEGIERRRRNARVLSWAGALVLVAGAALWFVPDRSNDDDGNLPALEITTSTRSDAQLLEPTATSTTVVTTTTAPPSTTITTRRASTTPTTRRSSPAPTAAPTTTSPPFNPGNPGTVNPIRTVPGPPPDPSDTTVPTTPTTQPGSQNLDASPIP